MTSAALGSRIIAPEAIRMHVSYGMRPLCGFSIQKMCVARDCGSRSGRLATRGDRRALAWRIGNMSLCGGWSTFPANRHHDATNLLTCRIYGRDPAREHLGAICPSPRVWPMLGTAENGAAGRFAADKDARVGWFFPAWCNLESARRRLLVGHDRLEHGGGLMQHGASRMRRRPARAVFGHGSRRQSLRLQLEQPGGPRGARAFLFCWGLDRAARRETAAEEHAWRVLRVRRTRDARCHR